MVLCWTGIERKWHELKCSKVETKPIACKRYGTANGWCWSWWYWWVHRMMPLPRQVKKLLLMKWSVLNMQWTEKLSTKLYSVRVYHSRIWCAVQPQKSCMRNLMRILEINFRCGCTVGFCVQCRSLLTLTKLMRSWSHEVGDDVDGMRFFLNWTCQTEYSQITRLILKMYSVLYR